MNVGDILQVTHEYTVSDQTCLNVFYYEVLAGTTSLAEPFVFLDELSSIWQAALSPTWAVNVTSVQIKAENLTDGLEISEFATGWSGTVAVNSLPPFNAIGVKLSRDTKITRNGAKRIAGLSEDASQNGLLVLTSGQRDGIEQYCSTGYFFQNVDGEGNDVQLAQRIIGRTKNASGVYELDLSKVNSIGSIVINPQVTSQTTRKV